MREADPGFDPARPVIPAYTRQPFDVTAPVAVITDPQTHQVAELAAFSYELVLHLLTRFFTHTEETDAQLELLVGAAVELMGEVVRPLGQALARLPVGIEHEGRTAGFAFEMYYLMSNFVPWREPAWALLHERTSILAQRCASGQHEAMRAAGERVRAIADRLAAHVPGELRGHHASV
jgi:hypothetical protein